MPEINSVVNVSITRQTKAVARAGFGVMMIFGPHSAWKERARTYTAASDMLQDNFESTDREYLAAVAAFSQNPGPTKVIIGRQHVSTVGVSVSNVLNSTAYTVTIDGIAFEFTSDVDATALEIAAGLVALIDAHADYTATDDLDGTFTISHATAGTGFGVAVDPNLTKETSVSTETAADCLTNIKQYNNDWYGVVCTDRTQAFVEAIAAWVEPEGKFFVTASDDTEILNPASTTDLGYNLKASAYDNTLSIYTATPDGFIDAALMANRFATDPGSSTWAYKTLAGVTVDTLTASQSTAAQDKNVNTYEVLGGVNVILEGKVASGEWADIIRGAKWFEVRLEERIYSLLVNLPKVPHNSLGYGTIEAEIRAQIQEGENAGFLDPTASHTVTMPTVISSADKINRELNNIEFVAYLAGAIHKVNIAGVITP